MATFEKRLLAIQGVEVVYRSVLAFLDGHVEHGSLRDWTLPVSAVWDRWHYRNRWPVEEFQHLDADNWAPLYGADELVDF